MSRLPLSFACWDYDRTRALQDGRVRAEGVDLNPIVLPVEETFYRQLRHAEFDVCEMSLSSYVLTLNRPDPPFVALPVFPSRFFRHQSIYVNTDTGIREPRDLVGRRVGVPEFQMTAAVWQRGILADDHGVPVDSVEYLTGGLAEPGRTEKIRLELPDRIRVRPIPAGATLSEMLADGEIDALYSAAAPPCFGTAPQVRHLFEDFTAVEQDYYRRTSIFPIMHVVALRRELHEANPWLARSLYKAFAESLEIAYTDLAVRNALKVMLPWLEQHLADTLRVLGPGYWDYGLEQNRHVLEAFARYSADQGLADRVWSADDLVLGQASDVHRV